MRKEERKGKGEEGGRKEGQEGGEKEGQREEKCDPS